MFSYPNLMRGMSDLSLSMLLPFSRCRATMDNWTWAKCDSFWSLSSRADVGSTNQRDVANLLKGLDVHVCVCVEMRDPER